MQKVHEVHKYLKDPTKYMKYNAFILQYLRSNKVHEVHKYLRVHTTTLKIQHKVYMRFLSLKCRYLSSWATLMVGSP